MRKCIIFLFATIFISSGLIAQKGHHTAFGIKSGINFSTFRISGSSSATLDANWKTGFVVGAFVKIPVEANFAIQPEFLYSSMGGHLKSSIASEDRYRLNYFSIPVLAKIKICKKLMAVAGPQLDMMIQAKKYNADGYSKITDDFEDHDLLLTGGLECHPLSDISITARYMHGFVDVVKSSSLVMKNQGVQITLGVKL
jgi:Outer membrane protein beta-barrel domain